MIDWTLTNLISSALMVGLIWTIQMVHYPSYRFIDGQSFNAFHKHHTFSISIIVVPMILVSSLSISLLLFQDPTNMLNRLSFTMQALAMFSTALFSIPCHQILAQGKHQATVERLIRTNWPRTILWSLKLSLDVLIYKT